MAITWVKVLEAVAQEDYEGARNLLNNCSKYSGGKDVEYHLLSGVIYYRINAFPESLSDIELALCLLENSKHYSCDEKNYLRCYADRFLDKLSRVPPLGEYIPEFSGDFSMLSSGNVREGIRLNFPL